MKIQKFVASLLQNGGASLNLQTNEFNPKNGYFVSIEGREFKFPINQLNDSIVNLFLQLNCNQLLNSELKNCFLGGWVDKDTVYLDVSVKYTDKRQALKAGLLNRQEAIYNANEQEVIFLPKAQTSGTLSQIAGHINQLLDKLMN